MRIPAVQVYFHDGNAFVSTMSDSRGLLVGEGPVSTIRDYRQRMEDLGRALVEAMQRSRSGAPRNVTSMTDQHVKLAGASSWEEFAKASISVDITTVDQQRKAMLWLPVKSGRHMEPVEDAVRYFSINERPQIISELVVELVDQANRRS